MNLGMVRTTLIALIILNILTIPNTFTTGTLPHGVTQLFEAEVITPGPLGKVYLKMSQFITMNRKLLNNRLVS